MSDGEHGLVLEKTVNHLLDPQLGLHVHSCGRLVQNNNLLVGNDRPLEGNNLPLSQGEIGAGTLHLEVQASAAQLFGVESEGNEVLNDFFVSKFELVTVFVADVLQLGVQVLSKGASKQGSLLGNNHDLATEGLEVQLGDISAIDKQLTVADLKTSPEQLDK